jgi:late competence protein required for DNA uptake (superfamily II DNA/RNA helicase)
MALKKVNYRIKCERCGNFVYKEEMSFHFGRKSCKECLRKQMVSQSYVIHIAPFIIREAGMKPLDQVIIENTMDEIIIRKKKNGI